MSVVPVIFPAWHVTPAQARTEQERLRTLLHHTLPPDAPRLLAGADTSYNRGSNRVAGAVVVWDMDTRTVVETATAVVETPFPYVPGLLTYREAPALMPAFAKLSVRPDVLLCNGHGIAHPRGFGLAAHLGVLFDLPAIGVAQKRLSGEHPPVGRKEGAQADLTVNGAVVGTVLRSRKGANPIYVSPGHRMTVPEAVRIIRAALGPWKLPIPIREAHILCNDVRCKDSQQPMEQTA